MPERDLQKIVSELNSRAKRNGDSAAARALYRIRYRGWLPCLHCREVKRPGAFEIDETLIRGRVYGCRECEEKILRCQETKKRLAEQREARKLERARTAVKQFETSESEKEETRINVSSPDFDILAVRRLRSAISLEAR